MRATPLKALVVGGTTEGGLGELVADRIRHESDEDVLRGSDPMHVYVPDREELDVQDIDAINEFVINFGPFDYIVYCAGVNQLQWVHDLSFDSLADTFEVNAFGFAMLMQCHEHHYPKARGSAVAIASDAARNPMRGSLAYCASKAALVQIGKCLARELAPRWRVNTVSPSIIEGTPMTQYIDRTVPEFRGWDVEKMREYERTQLPLGRRASRREVSLVVTHTLFGPDYQTGSDVHVSGGK